MSDLDTTPTHEPKGYWQEQVLQQIKAMSGAHHVATIAYLLGEDDEKRVANACARLHDAAPHRGVRRVSQGRYEYRREWESERPKRPSTGVAVTNLALLEEIRALRAEFAAFVKEVSQ